MTPAPTLLADCSAHRRRLFAAFDRLALSRRPNAPPYEIKARRENVAMVKAANSYAGKVLP